MKIEPNDELIEVLVDEELLVEVEEGMVESPGVVAAAAACVPGLLMAASQLKPKVAETPTNVAPAFSTRSRWMARLRCAGVSRCAVFMTRSVG
jgi:hypothetical protein